MNVIRVTKEFNFEMAHALYGYNGPCKNIHGHSYNLSVTLIGNVINEKENPINGMVIDFTDLKKIVQNSIISELDHTLILNGNSPHRDIKNNEDLFERILLVNFQPTCENLLLDFVGKIKSQLPENLKLHHLFLRETATSYAEWYAEDN